MVRRTKKRRTRKHKGSSKRRTRHRSRHGRSKKMHEANHNQHGRSKKMHEANHNQHGGKKKRRKSGGKRKLNGYFKAMLHAKKHKLHSFNYKGNKYVQKKHKHLTLYKKA